MIVVDASAAVEMLIHSAAGDACLDHAGARGPAITTAHFDAEVYAALRRAYRRGLVDRASLGVLVDQLGTFDAERVALRPFLPSVVQLVDVLGAHDVCYLLLAISRACPLLTCDLALARAATRLGIEVFAVERAGPA